MVQLEKNRFTTETIKDFLTARALADLGSFDMRQKAIFWDWVTAHTRCLSCKPLWLS